MKTVPWQDWEGRRLVALSHEVAPETRGHYRKQRFTGRRCAPQGDETSPLPVPPP